MKKITPKILVFTALVAITPSSTKGEPLSALPKTGLYVGAALGGADLTAKSNLLLRQAAGGAPTSQKFSLTTTDKNIAADIFVGYGKSLDYLSLEGELTGSFTPLKSTSTLGLMAANSQTLEINTTSAVGGALKLGYYLNTTTKFYLKIGLELRRFKVNFTDPSNTFANLNKSYNSTAFVPGLGLEIDLTPCLALRTEYRAALHPKKTFEVASAASKVTSVQAKPTIHYLNLGLVFKI